MLAQRRQSPMSGGKMSVAARPTCCQSCRLHSSGVYKNSQGGHYSHTTGTVHISAVKQYKNVSRRHLDYEKCGRTLGRPVHTPGLRSELAELYRTLTGEGYYSCQELHLAFDPLGLELRPKGLWTLQTIR